MHADPYDYLPPPKEAVLTLQKGNMNSPLCKAITIVEDCDAEMLEEFKVGLELVEAECAKVQFHPNYTTVKITDDDALKGTYQSQHTHTHCHKICHLNIATPPSHSRNCVPDARTTYQRR